MMRKLGDLTIYVVPTWVQAWRYLGPPPRPPSKARGRRGTRKAWKRRNAWRGGCRLIPVEPDHVMQTPGRLFCTAAQFAAIEARAAEAAA
jgi:hypothetical protein